MDLEEKPNKPRPQFGKNNNKISLRRWIVAGAISLSVFGLIFFAAYLKQPDPTTTTATGSNYSNTTPSFSPPNSVPNSKSASIPVLPPSATPSTTSPFSNTNGSAACRTVGAKVVVVSQAVQSVSHGLSSPSAVEASMKDLANVASSQSGNSSDPMKTILSDLSNSVSQFRTDMISGNGDALSGDIKNVDTSIASFKKVCS